MAGRPRTRAMLAELERLAQAAGVADDGTPLTPIDYVCEYVASGADEDGTLHTFSELARTLTDNLKKQGVKVSPGMISQWVNSTSENKAKIAAARALAAHVFAEQTLSVIDDLADTEVTREEVALAKERAAVRQWLASKWNRGTYGADATVQINNISMADQHLAALTRRKEIAKAKVQLLPAPVSEGADYEVVSE